MQPPKRPSSAPWALAEGQRLVDVTLEETRPRDLGAERASALHVLDGRAEHLRARALTCRDARHTTDRLAQADHRGWLGRRIGEQMKRARPRVERRELDRRVAPDSEAQDLRRVELELRSFELELCPSGLLQHVACA